MASSGVGVGHHNQNLKMNANQLNTHIHTTQCAMQVMLGKSD